MGISAILTAVLLTVADYLLVFPKLFVYLAPGSINKGNVTMFALATATMWNEGKQ